MGDVAVMDENEKKWGRPIYSHGPIIRRFVAAYVALAAACTLGLYFDYKQDQAQERDRKERRVHVNTALTSNCADIELIKQHLRADAVDEYNRLDETLRLLKLKRTAEIERIAKRNRDRTLHTFVKEPCPRNIIENGR